MIVLVVYYAMGLQILKWKRSHIDQRILQMQAEGVIFYTNVLISEISVNFPVSVTNLSNIL